jgi:acetyl esterase/lipase
VKKTALSVLLGFLAFAPAQAQPSSDEAAPDTVLLWPEGAPGAKGDTPSDPPTLTIYRPPPERATGAAMLVFPGGGYTVLAMEKEGHKFARWLNSMGVAAFVLKYRLGDRYDHPAPLRDAQRALRYVHARSEALGIDPDRVGVMGFSAGGHLAATAATLAGRDFGAHPKSTSTPESTSSLRSGRSLPLGAHPKRTSSGVPEDSLSGVSARPDLLVLGYPVISFVEDYAHAWSRKQILGEDYDPETARLLSPEKQVTAETPPSFIFSTNEDEGVPAENSVAFYLALRDAGVPAELHVYERGPHGVGMAAEDFALSSWTDRLADWLQLHGWL